MSIQDFNIDEDTRLEIQMALDEYEKQIGIWENNKISIPIYLTMPISQLTKKAPEELIEAEYEILRYSAYIQRIINHHYKWERWANSKLDELTAFYLPEIDKSYGFNERTLMAKNSPELCQNLNKFIRENRLKLDSLKDVPKHIDAMAGNIRDIRFLAIKREKYDN